MPSHPAVPRPPARGGRSRPEPLGRLSDRLRAWPAAESGGVATIFGLCLLPLGIAVGAALDYSRASDARSALFTAADAAALASVNPGALELKASKARSNAESYFDNQTVNVRFANDVKAKVQVDDAADGRTSSISFTATVPTTFMRLAGVSSLTVSGNVKAASAPPTYIDFHLLLDNTPSMGVGATPADIATMVANTPDKCAFACHDLSSLGKDYYTLAKKLGVTMRIDVVRAATQKLMDTATATASVPGQYRAAISTFGAACGTGGLGSISPLTSKLSSVRSDAGNIDLMTIPYQNFNNDQCTDFDGMFSAVNATISAPGDGRTSGTPQKVLFFVSDGVADAYKPGGCSQPTTGGRCQEPISLAACTALKNRGIKIAVLYTTYLPLPTNGWYKTWIEPFAPQIPTRMQSCASPELYFEVSPSQGIAEAMEALFKKSIAMARLSR